MIARRAQYNQQILVGHITPDSPANHSAISALSSKIAHSGLRTAERSRPGNCECGARSYTDIFWVLGALCSIMFVLAFFLKKNDLGAGGDVAVG